VLTLIRNGDGFLPVRFEDWNQAQMEKITIKGFGPIKEAEIEIRRLLVLIGEQASGKSTIAKLIYFFKSIPEGLYSLNRSWDHGGLEGLENPEQHAKNQFLGFFGSPRQREPFEIEYEYVSNKNVKIHFDGGDRLVVKFSQTILEGLSDPKIGSGIQEQFELEKQAEKETEERKRSQLFTLSAFKSLRIRTLIHEVFGGLNVSRLFIIAGREPTISYQPAFESYFRDALNKLVASSFSSTSRLGGETGDEILMLQFIDEVQRIRAVFQKYGGIESLIENPDSFLNGVHPTQIIDRVHAILKAKYSVDGSDEKLTHEGGFVYLRDASSGQKEAIRILQSIVLTVQEQKKAFRVIEEPEAHLFPIAQKYLTELLVFMANAQAENQVIITTHSPYILTTLNSLLFASRVVEKNPGAEVEVSKVAPKEFRIDPSEFGAYSLGNSFEPEKPYCVDIVDHDMGMIDQNYLDAVSYLLGMEFDHLMSIHGRTFSRDGN
jgi:AAA15 family ATPase/GTPase